MDKLYTVDYETGRRVPVSYIEGIVEDSILTSGEHESYAFNKNGLALKLIGRKDYLLLHEAQFRVDVGEKVRIYSTNLANGLEMQMRAMEGLQILNAGGTEIKFQYKEGPNREFLDE